MQLFAKAEDWLQQSSLLLQARPTTTRVTTKYKISKPKAARQSKKQRKVAASESTSDAAVTPIAASGKLELKTYDPVSGACLKYKTQQGAEVGRLIASLGRLGKRMAALPDDAIEQGMDIDAAAPAKEDTEAPPAAAQTQQQSQSQQQQGGGNKKKKKGKK